MKELEISLRYASQAAMIMDDIIRLFNYDGIEVKQTSTNTYMFVEDEEDDEVIETSIREALSMGGIPEDEYEINII